MALCQRKISFCILCFPQTPLPPGRFCSLVSDSLLSTFHLPNNMALSVSWVAPSWLQCSKAAREQCQGQSRAPLKLGPLIPKLNIFQPRQDVCNSSGLRALCSNQGRRTVLHLIFFLPWSSHMETPQGDRYAGVAGWMQNSLLPGKPCSPMWKQKQRMEEEGGKGTRFGGTASCWRGWWWHRLCCRAGGMTVPSPSPQGARQHLLRPPSSQPHGQQ